MAVRNPTTFELSLVSEVPEVLSGSPLEGGRLVAAAARCDDERETCECCCAWYHAAHLLLWWSECNRKNRGKPLSPSSWLIATSS